MSIDGRDANHHLSGPFHTAQTSQLVTNRPIDYGRDSRFVNGVDLAIQGNRISDRGDGDRIMLMATTAGRHVDGMADASGSSILANESVFLPRSSRMSRGPTSQGLCARR
jgi:hypothetical protein